MMAFLLYTFIVIFVKERTDNYMNTKSINVKISQYPILNEVNLSLKLKNVSERTILNYMDGIARFLDFISYDNQFEITSDMFRDYLIYLHSTSLKKNSINFNNSYIRFFFFSVLDKPLNLYKVPMARFARKEIDFLFDFQIHALFSACSSDSRMDCIIKLGLCCGLRINEIIQLKVSDICTRDKSNMCIYVRESKRNKSRYAPLDNTIYRAIQKYAKEYHIRPGTDRFFVSFHNGNKTCNETIRRHFYHYCRLAQIPDSYTFHCLRHTYAVNFLRAGGDILDLKYRLGHSSLSTTSLYLHYSKNMMNTHISYYDNMLKKGDSHDN